MEGYKTMQHWCTDRYINQWNRIEDPERDPQTYPTDFLQSCKSNSMEERQPFQQSPRAIGHPQTENMDTNQLILTSYTKK